MAQVSCTLREVGMRLLQSAAACVAGVLQAASKAGTRVFGFGYRSLRGSRHRLLVKID